MQDRKSARGLSSGGAKGASSASQSITLYRSPEGKEAPATFDVAMYEDTPKVDVIKLAQQGSVEIPSIVLRPNMISAQTKKRIVEIQGPSQTPANKKLCKKGRQSDLSPPTNP